MTFAQCLENASAAPLDPDILDDLARFALAEEEEAQALQILVPAARRAGNALLWQWTGLLQRALDDHLEAFASLTEARRLEPTDFAIAHALARVALEAGWDAVAHFDRARALGPPTSELLMGLSAARFAQGRGEEAAAEIDAILAVSPFWLDGHRHLAQLRTLLGEPDRAANRSSGPSPSIRPTNACGSLCSI